MPHTMAPINQDSITTHPVIPQGHGKPGYTVGLDPASPGNSRPSSRAGSRSASRAGSRSASPFRHDSFFQRGTPGSQEREQHEATMRQVGTAQDATYEADLERAMRRSKRDEEERRRRAGESTSRERSASHNRGMSRIRAAIKELVNDPFWHRSNKAESEHQDEYMKRVILDEVNNAKAGHVAGEHDRQARSRSRVRSPLASRDASRVRLEHHAEQPHIAAASNGAPSGLAPPITELPSVPKTDISASSTRDAPTQTELKQNGQVGELVMG